MGLFGSIAIGVVILGSGLMGLGPSVRVVDMLDRCDPDSFNEMFGDGICLFDHQGVNVDSFLKVLGNSGQIGAWHFSPRQVQLKEGQAVQAHNSGGELHTFTEVDEFGGGFIQPLNDLTGNPVPAPECLASDLEFIPPGGCVRRTDGIRTFTSGRSRPAIGGVKRPAPAAPAVESRVAARDP